MKREALRRISACYTKDLAHLHTHADDSIDAIECPISWKGEDCIGVLHLARQLGLDELVPAALYRCAVDVEFDRVFQAVAKKERLHTLTFQEMQDCVCSRDKLIAQNTERYAAFSKLRPYPDCGQSPRKKLQFWKTIEPCTAIIKTVVVSATEKSGRFPTSAALYPVDKYIPSDKEASGELCATCRAHVTAVDAQQRENIWSSMCTKYCTPPTKVSAPNRL